MKKIIAITLLVCMTISLAACGGTKPETPSPTKAPDAPAAKTKMTAEEIAAAIDKAETAEDFNKLISALEGTYGENEKITLGGDSITLADLRQMAELFAAIENGGDEPGGGDEPAGTPVSAEAAAKAAGDWTGVYTKFVGDTDGVTDSPFALTLNADGTAVSSRDGTDYNAVWSMDGNDVALTEKFMGMTIDYTGTLENGVLRLFNGDPKDDLTCEYVYGQGDVSGIEIPHGEIDTSALGRFRGDWNGALLFTNCTGKYEYLDDGVPVAAIARFAVRDDGSIEPFIGVNVEDTPFEDLTASYSDFWEELTISGKWINAPFEGVAVKERNGTLHIEVPIAKEAGSLLMVMNFRRLDDTGWTDENPRLGAAQIEYCKGKTFGELAEIIGYSFWDYPSPDEG